MSYDVLKSENVYNGRVFHIEKDEITLPDGRTCARETVVHGGAAAMIPIDENGKIIFVRQYRHSARTETLELPAGTLEKGEDPLVCATRELEEETGYISKELIYMGEYYMNQGISSAKCELFFAKCTEKREKQLEKTEFVRTKLIPISQFHELIYNNQFKLLIGIAGWYKAKYMRLV